MRQKRNDVSPFDLIAKWQQSIPVDVNGLAADLGVPVFPTSLSPDISGSIMRHGGGYKILVNANHSPTRQRFTVAHEIAHYILHKDMIGDGIEDDRLFRSKVSDKFEAQANNLAADILMPFSKILEYEKAGISDPGKLARRFGVSQRAMEVRLSYKPQPPRPQMRMRQYSGTNS